MAVENEVTMRDFWKDGCWDHCMPSLQGCLGVLACPKCGMVMRQKAEMNEEKANLKGNLHSFKPIEAISYIHRV